MHLSFPQASKKGEEKNKVCQPNTKMHHLHQSKSAPDLLLNFNDYIIYSHIV